MPKLLTIHSVTPLGSGSYLADVEIDFSDTGGGSDERVSYGVNATDTSQINQAICKAIKAGTVTLAQPPAPSAPPPVTLTFLQFLALFTSSEQIAIAGSSDPQVKVFLLMAAGASQIILSDAKTAGGIGYLVAQGLLTSQRAAQILANSPPA